MAKTKKKGKAKKNGVHHVLAERFSTHVKKLREKKGFSQSKVARDLKVTPGWVCRLESHGKSQGNPSLTTAETVARYLKVDPGSLFAPTHSKSGKHKAKPRKATKKNHQKMTAAVATAVEAIEAV